MMRQPLTRAASVAYSPGRVVAAAAHSYAFATDRRTNVELGSRLLDTPAFMWLDAYSTRSTNFWLSLQSTAAAAVLAEAASDRALITLERRVTAEGQIEYHYYAFMRKDNQGWIVNGVW
jgi:hypothetical protein